MNDASRAPSGIHGERYECSSRSPRTPTAHARIKTASRHGGETFDGTSDRGFSWQAPGRQWEPGSRTRDAHRYGIAAAEAERGESPLHAAIRQRVQQRHQDAGAAGTDGVT
jgi:hypothetical protein